AAGAVVRNGQSGAARAGVDYRGGRAASGGVGGVPGIRAQAGSGSVTERRPNTVEAWIVIAGLAALWLGLGSRVLDQARAHDFLSLYSGAYMVSHGRAADLYDPAAQFAVEKTLAPGNTELVPFIR